MLFLVINAVKLVHVAKQYQPFFFSFPELHILALKLCLCCNLLQSTNLLLWGQAFTVLWSLQHLNCGLLLNTPLLLRSVSSSFCFFSTLCVWRTDSRCCESYEINDFLTRLHFPAGNHSIGVNLQILGNVAGNLSVPIGGLSYYIRG